MKLTSLAILKKIIDEMLTTEEVDKLYSAISNILEKKLPADAAWGILSQRHLKPGWPLRLHKTVFEFIYGDWDEDELGPPPVWVPTKEYIENSDTHQLIKSNGFADYDEYYQWTIDNETLYVEKSIKKLDLTIYTQVYFYKQKTYRNPNG